VIEAEAPDGELFATQRLREVLTREYEKSSAGIIAALLEAVRTFSGSSSFRDDISLLLLKFK
jgi:sigma-B regulation protein RsbU (phosphoserine phosphatase)